MNDRSVITEISKILASASAAQAAALDLIEILRFAGERNFLTNNADEPTRALADSLMLLLQALPEITPAETQLLGAVEKYLDETE